MNKFCYNYESVPLQLASNIQLLRTIKAANFSLDQWIKNKKLIDTVQIQFGACQKWKS